MSRARILVADDDALTRELVATVLAGAGNEVLQATDGPSALRELYSSRPDLLVLDVEMPGMDGWATLERVRDLSDVPVLSSPHALRNSSACAGCAPGRTTTSSSRSGTRSSRPASMRCCDAAAAAPAPGEVRRRTDVRRLRPEVRQLRRGEVALTPLEFALLRTLLEHPNQVLNREQLLEPDGATRRRLTRRGEGLHRLPAAQARPGAALSRADRDRARLRLPLPLGCSPPRTTGGRRLAAAFAERFD